MKFDSDEWPGCIIGIAILLGVVLYFYYIFPWKREAVDTDKRDIVQYEKQIADIDNCVTNVLKWHDTKIDIEQQIIARLKEFETYRESDGIKYLYEIKKSREETDQIIDYYKERKAKLLIWKRKLENKIIEKNKKKAPE